MNTQIFRKHTSSFLCTLMFTASTATSPVAAAPGDNEPAIPHTEATSPAPATQLVTPQEGIAGVAAASDEDESALATSPAPATQPVTPQKSITIKEGNAGTISLAEVGTTFTGNIGVEGRLYQALDLPGNIGVGGRLYQALDLLSRNQVARIASAATMDLELPPRILK